MEGKLGRSNRKRPFTEDFEGDSDPNDRPTKQRKVRFPKGKKVKPSDEAVDRAKVEDDSNETTDVRLASKERAMHRNQITAELFDEEINDIGMAEVTYKDNENFNDDGIQIEPFNLEKEREEGYFDAQGNFVEYVNEKEVQDAWLNSIEVDPKYAAKRSIETTNDDSENDVPALSSEDIGIIKKRIANLLEPGETVLQALRRLKGGPNKSKEKMSAETQFIFDQLTEDADKLLEHGEYNVYNDKQEVFKREAEGYERLALARGKGTSISLDPETSDHNMGKGLSSDLEDLGAASSVLSNTDLGTTNPKVSAGEIPRNGADAYDMFADDDDTNITKPSSESTNLVVGTNSNGVSQQLSDGLNTVSETGALQNDYVYDETSGYYYSSSLGYYYDPSTGLYCHAASRQWYSFNEETGSYDEVHEVASNTN